MEIAIKTKSKFNITVILMCLGFVIFAVAVLLLNNIAQKFPGNNQRNNFYINSNSNLNSKSKSKFVEVKNVIAKEEGVYVFYSQNIKINSSYFSLELYDRENNLLKTSFGTYSNVLFVKPDKKLNVREKYKIHIKALSIQGKYGDLIRKDFAREFTVTKDDNMFTRKYSPFGEFLYFTKLPPICSTGFKELDENGVVKIKLSNSDEYIYNPVTIAQVGLQEYGFYIQGKGKEHYILAKNQADWLVNNIDNKTNQWLNYYDFTVGGMNVTLKKPWGSAMAQGQAISLLVRMYHLTGDRKYLYVCEKALKPLTVDVSEGGLVQDFYGHPYYEEYPTEPASYTLNGFMFTLLGLYDLSCVSTNSQAKELYVEGMRTLNYCLHFYDYDNISAYHLGFMTTDTNTDVNANTNFNNDNNNDNTDVNTNVVNTVHTSKFYHVVHICELEALYSVTKYPLYKAYHDLWKSYDINYKIY
ncbi:hypothetical protein CLTEP_12980 [Clostridium tepidiprofundi DSM 19306]|uniref:D-glucuronyl C5-epimerase C-terminal domain-containing protein n=1 Tax=Clostridium tepidiprofundi DSM 19306 TaxID=1121338 RepID=A0A151B455_9CLOT|nr:D-glucuronyl C5-epimerase family protein [Clostridium tepidiprofundi]KYH34701.1 hypothetical protein CLTEP_12980 [Clostridium tepidiprofundi DSM 19306]